MNTDPSDTPEEGWKTCPRCEHRTEHWALICEKCEYEWPARPPLVTPGPPQIFGSLGKLFGVLAALVFTVGFLLTILLGIGALLSIFVPIAVGLGAVSVICFVLHAGLNQLG